MLDENIQVIDIDARQWVNLFSLLTGSFFRTEKKRETKPGSRLLIVHEQGKVIKALDSKRGIITRELEEISPQDLNHLAKELGVNLIIALERGALRELVSRAESGLNLSLDYVAQLLEYYQSFRELVLEGKILLYPHIPLRELKYQGLLNLLKIAVPEEKVIILVVFDPEAEDLSGLPIFTSLILRIRKGHQLDLLTTTEALGDERLKKIQDWRKDYHKIIRLAEEKFGSVFFGIFTCSSALQELAGQPRKELLKSLTKFLKQDKIIINPFPLRLKMLLRMGKFLKF